MSSSPSTLAKLGQSQLRRQTHLSEDDLKLIFHPEGALSGSGRPFYSSPFVDALKEQHHISFSFLNWSIGAPLGYCDFRPSLASFNVQDIEPLTH